ncbi:hypothetical protein [Micrococcus luteus]|uniref:hypothetical protein n=1 Tax=Micrococcus luteus TaxID=1270 RepID=UPI003797D71A
MVKVEIVPWDVHEALAGAADAGADLETAVRTAGDQALESFGSASAAEEAFRGFWEARDGLGQRAAAVLAHNAAEVSDAAGEFIAMDQDVQSRAEQTVAENTAAHVTEGNGRKGRSRCRSNPVHGTSGHRLRSRLARGHGQLGWGDWTRHSRSGQDPVSG